MRVSNRIQVRYTHELPDDTVQLPGTAARGDSKGSFRIRRAKFKIDGWFYKTWLLYEFQANWPEAAAPGASVTKFDSNGYFVQAGYLLDAGRKWEVVGRYGSFDPTDLRGGDDQTEIWGGINYYYNRHALKVQADFGRLENKATNVKNNEFRLQTQFIF